MMPTLSSAIGVIVNIGSGNGLVPPGTKPLTKPMLTITTTIGTAKDKTTGIMTNGSTSTDKVGITMTVSIQWREHRASIIPGARL